jgi:adenylate cyclase, class 2
MPRRCGAREVEVKFLVRDTEMLLAALEARGIELSSPVSQDDQAFAPVGWCYGQSKLGVAFTRLRTVDGRHTFTLKRPAENALSCEEHEREVSDRGQMHRAIVAAR